MTVRFKRAVTDVGRCSAVEVGRTRLSREFLGQTIEFSARGIHRALAPDYRHQQSRRG